MGNFGRDETDSFENGPNGHLHPRSFSAEDNASGRIRLKNVGVIGSEQDDDPSLIETYDAASFVTEFSGMDTTEPEPTLPKRKKSVRSKRLPRRKVSEEYTIPSPPVLQRGVTAPTLGSPAMLRNSTSPSVGIAPLPLLRSSTDPLMALSPRPPVRKLSPTSQKKSLSAKPPIRKQSSKDNVLEVAEEELLPELQREKHMSFSRRSLQSQDTVERAEKTTQLHRNQESPPLLIGEPSGENNSQHAKDNRHDLEYGISDARNEAMQYALSSGVYGDTCMMSSRVWSESESISESSSRNESVCPFTNEYRRMSSLTFLSLQAPRAPGEPLKTKHGEVVETEKPNHSAKCVDANTREVSKKAKGLGASSKETIMVASNWGQNIPQYIEEQIVLDNRAIGISHSTNRMGLPPLPPSTEYTSRNEGVQAVAFSSMVTIPELEVSSVPAPTRNLQLQPDVEEVPRAWSIHRAWRSFASSHHGQQQRQPQPSQGVDYSDDTSQASRTDRSLLTAKWSLIFPTRRLESVQPIAVKRTKDGPAIRRTHIACGLAVFLIAIACLTIILVVLMIQGEGEPNGGPTGTMSPYAATLAPTTSPGDLTPQPTLPLRPKPGNGITTEPRAAGDGKGLR
jgi:hypothetical protein